MINRVVIDPMEHVNFITSFFLSKKIKATLSWQAIQKEATGGFGQYAVVFEPLM